MGYNIYYEGTINVDKPLDEETYKIIRGLATTLRMIWDADKLEQDGIAKKEDIGEWGEFFFGFKDIAPKKRKEFYDRYLLTNECPPPNQPWRWCDWTVTENRMGLVWEQGPNSFCGHEWLQYIVKKILLPRGYQASGIINWFDENGCTKWHTVVDGKSVRKYKGYSSQQSEPGIFELTQALAQDWETLLWKTREESIREEIENKVTFVSKREPWKVEHTDEKSVLMFHVFFDNHITRVSYDWKRICYAEYIYHILKNEEEEIVWGYSGSEAVDEESITRLQQFIEDYISTNPDLLEELVSSPTQPYREEDSELISEMLSEYPLS